MEIYLNHVQTETKGLIKSTPSRQYLVEGVMSSIVFYVKRPLWTRLSYFLDLCGTTQLPSAMLDDIHEKQIILKSLNCDLTCQMECFMYP